MPLTSDVRENVPDMTGSKVVCDISSMNLEVLKYSFT